MNIALLLLSGGITNRGAEHSMHLLAEDMGKIGHSVDVYEAGVSAAKDYSTIRIGLPAIPKNSKPTSLIGKIVDRLYLNQRGLLTLLFSLKALPHLLNHHYDVLIPTDGFWQVLICKFIKLFRPTIKIATWGLAGIGWTDAHTLKLKPDLFVALSPTMATWAKTVNPGVAIATIPLQVDLNLFTPNATPHSLPLKHPLVITVAALNAYKRIDLVIHAVAETKELSLLVLGEGEEEAKLTALGKKLLGDRFYLTHAAFEELPGIYAAADVFTLVSEPQEAFGRVFVEAMACGLPVVTTTDPVRKWIVGEGGAFIHPSDSKGYAKALIEAATRKKQVPNNIATFSREKVAKEFLSRLQ
jgi:glycosyltransferase involved in cell wall biosynthesis